MVEVKAAIKVMKSGGADGVTAEMLKAKEIETPCLLIREIWESETIPNAWKTGLVKLPKKGKNEKV